VDCLVESRSASWRARWLWWRRGDGCGRSGLRGHAVAGDVEERKEERGVKMNLATMGLRLWWAVESRSDGPPYSVVADRKPMDHLA
jgi:hypothetical protein